VARFITFEGLDGSGKSTHLERAASWLRERGLDVLVTREPGGTEIGARIRSLLLDGRSEGMDGKVELLLMFADRRQHLVEVIEPALAAGRTVLCDRFTDSTIAYQGFGRGVPLAELDEVDHFATGRRRPDRTLYFDLPEGAARRRGQSSHRRRTGRVNRLDAEALEFYRRVREGYLERARLEPERFRVIDSEGSISATEGAVREALADLVEGEAG